MPAVSVIMPAYNVEPYISAAIRSVLGQTWRDFELIVVDDGATDGTFEAARRAAGGDPRVTILRQTNAGLSAARNTGLRHASAPVIALLDSDDLWTPTFLAHQMARMEADPSIDVVSGNAWNLGGRQNGEPARPWPDPRQEPDLTSILADEEAVFVMSLFRRRVYEVIETIPEKIHCWTRLIVPIHP